MQEIKIQHPTVAAHDCAILIASCGAYSDAWGPFFTLFSRYWPDCPFPVYVVTEKGTAPSPAITITLPKDFGWADNVRYAIDAIGARTILYILDDVPLMKKVDTAYVLHLLSILHKENAAYLRLYPAPEPNGPYKEYKEVGLIAPSAPYRTSTMAAFWDTDMLRDILKPGENAWQMEIQGTERSRNYPRPFLSVYAKEGPVIDHFSTAIKKGKWQWDAIRFLRREGITIGDSKRRVETFWQYLIRWLEHVRLVGGVVRRIRRIWIGKKHSVANQKKL